jgi:hypothetical protein
VRLTVWSLGGTGWFCPPSAAATAFGLLLGYESITATVTEAGIKDTATGSVTLLTA